MTIKENVTPAGIEFNLKWENYFLATVKKIYFICICKCSDSKKFGKYVGFAEFVFPMHVILIYSQKIQEAERRI